MPKGKQSLDTIDYILGQNQSDCKLVLIRIHNGVESIEQSLNAPTPVPSQPRDEQPVNSSMLANNVDNFIIFSAWLRYRNRSQRRC